MVDAFSLGISDFLQSWSQKIAAKNRFVVLCQFNNEAILDRETQLVWEKSPSTDKMDWDNAIEHCYSLNSGGRGGWRLPTVEELRTLVDPNMFDPALPAGNPFNNVQASLSDYYWSATSSSDNSLAWDVSMINGFVHSIEKTSDIYVWCVRGGHRYDGQ
jgi:hypothetical protein